MAATTGLNANGNKRWHSIKLIGRVAEQEKFIGSYLEGSYPALSVAGLTEAQKLALLSEAVINQMTLVAAGVAHGRVASVQSSATAALIAAELASMATSGVEG
jgi:hypothetical protein